jgi:hypothetical protein
MSSTDTLLAVFEPLPQWVNFLAMTVAVLVVAIGSLLWFAVFRRKKQRKHKHRRHRREQRQLNPTLAQTGGLPPARENEKSPGQTPPP